MQRLCYFFIECGLLCLAANAEGLFFLSPSPEKNAEVKKYVEQLGDPSWRIREEAGRKIQEYGMDAAEELQKAMESSDLTTATTAKFYYSLLSHGLVRSTDSEKVREILSNYGNSESVNFAIIDALRELPAEEGIVPLVRIALSEDNPPLSLRAAAAVLWKLPYPTVLHPIPSVLPSQETKKSTDETVLLTHENLEEILEKRAKYTQTIRDHLTSSPASTAGFTVLKNVLEVELSSDSPEVLQNKISQQFTSLRRIFTPQPTETVTLADALGLQEWEYLLAEQMKRRVSPEHAETFLKDARKTQRIHSATVRYLSDSARQSFMIRRLWLVQQLFGRGHWAWGQEEGSFLLTGGSQSIEMVFFAQIFANDLHYSGNHEKAASALLTCLENPIFRTAIRRYDQNEKEFQARARYYLACQAGVENNADKQKKLLEEVLTIDPDETDTLILCWQIAESGSDEAWKQKTSQRIDASLDRLEKKIAESSNMDRYQNQNVYAWLAANTHRRLDQALEAARAAVLSQPDNGGIRDTLAHVLFAQGKLPEAVAEQKIAAQKEPNDLEIRRNLWKFEEQNQEKEK